MTTDDDPTDGPARDTWQPVGELPGQLPFDRLDYGDAEQLAEMAGTDEPRPRSRRRLVDAPIQLPPPYDRARARRPTSGD